MPNYAVRVQLKGDPSYEQYEILHGVMENLGFERRIWGTGSDGVSKYFALPHATYWGTSVNDCQTVRNQVRAAVRNNVQDNVLVFVVQAETWSIW